MNIENNSYYHIQDIIEKEFRSAFRLRMTEEETSNHFKKELRDCSEKMIEISDECKLYFRKQLESEK
jgi:hypothetical protein